MEKVVTKKKLSEEEYRNIENKSDYVWVKEYPRNGSSVRGHYRRKPKKRKPKT